MRRRTGIILLGSLLLASTPCLAQVQAEVLSADALNLTFASSTVSIDVIFGPGSGLLGSYDAALAWNPAILQYVSDTAGGLPPFDTAVVNRSQVGNGLLLFSDASPLGAGGRVNIMNVTFMVVAEPFSDVLIDLSFSSIFAAIIFQDVSPILTVDDGMASVTDFDFALRAVDLGGSLFEWNIIPGAVRYDLIRGSVDQLFDDGFLVHLGQVTCVEDDSLDTTTGAGTEPTNPDLSTPLPGEAFFYIVRFEENASAKTYGFGNDGGHERVVDIGGCT